MGSGMSVNCPLRDVPRRNDLADGGLLGGKALIVRDPHALRFLDEDFGRAAGHALSERTKRVPSNDDVGCVRDGDGRADGPVPPKDAWGSAVASERVAFNQDLGAIMRDVARRLAHAGLGTRNSRNGRCADDNIGVIIVGESAVAHGEVANR